MQKSKCDELPSIDIKTQRKGFITYLFENAYGKLAFEDEKLVGYMTFFTPIEQFHGNGMEHFHL